MDKASLLTRIADTAYNVGFGAKRHFATYDIVEKAPGWIGFLSLAVGVFSLIVESLATKHVSASLLVLGIASLLINAYSDTKQEYEATGRRLTLVFNELKSLYLGVKASDKPDFGAEMLQLKRLEEEFGGISISKQILFSDWYAHYKFFWQHQIDWLDEHKHFSLWRDKLPLSFTTSLVLSATVTLVFLISRLKGLL